MRRYVRGFATAHSVAMFLEPAAARSAAAFMTNQVVLVKTHTLAM